MRRSLERSFNNEPFLASIQNRKPVRVNRPPLDIETVYKHAIFDEEAKLEAGGRGCYFAIEPKGLEEGDPRLIDPYHCLRRSHCANEIGLSCCIRAVHDGGAH